MLKIVCAGKSDVGCRRSNNEDSLLVRPDLGVVAVADGMGGAAAGELASAIFVDTILQVFPGYPQPAGQTVSDLVQKVYFLANERIVREGRENPDNGGMGCTAELLGFDEQNYVVGHVGDSRTYLFRSGRLRQVTKDHSIVQEQLDQGLITPAEARAHAMKNVIMRAVGVRETLAVDLIQGRGQPGDIFLLCSDGLTDMIEDEKIIEILSLPLNLEQRADGLIGSANLAGGYDNVTVALCQIV
jgi:PPM family protein phosphatase